MENKYSNKYVIETGMGLQNVDNIKNSSYFINETEKYINGIDDPEIRTIMRKYYIDGMSWNEIARVYYKKNCDGSTPRKKVNLYLKERKEV